MRFWTDHPLGLGCGWPISGRRRTGRFVGVDHEYRSTIFALIFTLGLFFFSSPPVIPNRCNPPGLSVTAPAASTCFHGTAVGWGFRAFPAVWWCRASPWAGKSNDRFTRLFDHRPALQLQQKSNRAPPEARFDVRRSTERG